MVSEYEAAREAQVIAGAWLFQDKPVGVTRSFGQHEFDLGYVFWRVPGQGEPEQVGEGRVVVDRQTGELTHWPTAPAEVVAEQYRAYRREFPAVPLTWDPLRRARRDRLRAPFPEHVTRLRLADGRLREARGMKGEGTPNLHPLVAEFLGELPVERRVRGYDRCSELSVVSDALHVEDARRSAAGEPGLTLDEARELFGGSELVTRRVREPDDPLDGEPAPVCVSCLALLRHFGIGVASEVASAPVSAWAPVGTGDEPEDTERSGRFSPEVEQVLRAAGWFPGRELSPSEIGAMCREVLLRRGRFGGKLSSWNFPDRVLAEFGGLAIGGGRPGVEVTPRPFALDPRRALHRVETLIDAGRAIGNDLFPLGVEGEDEAVLAITTRERIVAVDHLGEWFLGKTIDEALELLITGRQPRPVMPGDADPPIWPVRPPRTYPEDEYPLVPLKRPVGAAFFLPHTPQNLPYGWLPDMITRIGYQPRRGAGDTGWFQLDDWGEVWCVVYALDLEYFTVMVVAFEKIEYMEQRVEKSIFPARPGEPAVNEPAPPPDASPLARAFRDACAVLAPELEVALVETIHREDLLRRFADQLMDVLTADGRELLARGFGLVYLTSRNNYDLAAPLARRRRDQLPVEGGRIFFQGTGNDRW